MLLASEQLVLPLRLASVVVPVAVYFLVLGLLNSRRRPQLLTARQDFALLVLALSPLGLLPVWAFVHSAWGAIVAVAIGGVLMKLLLPPRRSWVIYNVTGQQARQVARSALADCGLDVVERPDGFDLPGGARLEVRSFSLLRNATLRLTGADAQVGQFEANIWRRLAVMHTDASPMAVSMMLVASIMLVAPLAMVAQRAPEIVRILTDLMG